MGYDLRLQSSGDEPPFIHFSNGTVSSSESILLPEAAIERCMLDAQRQVHRLEAILHGLTSAMNYGNVASFGAVALFEESNRRLKRELDEFSLDALAVASIVRSA